MTNTKKDNILPNVGNILSFLFCVLSESFDIWISEIDFYKMEGLEYMNNLENSMSTEQTNFDQLDASFFLLGLLSAFDNRYQAKADNFFEEISWKQFFAICCINLCEEPPAIKELAQIMGSSHQNVKQILNKLEIKGYVQTISDQNDKRIQRIVVTEKTKAFLKEQDEGSQIVVGKIFEGIAPEDIATTISTILKMEKNLEEV